MDIYQRASKLYHSSRPENAEEAIDLLMQNALSHPQDAKAWFELAGCFDYLGRGREALENYERVSAIGAEQLPEIDRPRLFLQWGSTLRNLKRLDESEGVLLEGARRYPEMKALKAFIALTKYSRGAYQEACQALFVLLHSKYPGDHSLEEYARALDWYIDHLDATHFSENNLS